MTERPVEPVNGLARGLAFGIPLGILCWVAIAALVLSLFG